MQLTLVQKRLGPVNLMAGIEKDNWLWNTRANDTGSIMEGFSWFIRFAAERRLLWPSTKIRQLTIARASTYSPHSRRYGVTITELLVTVFPAGHSLYTNHNLHKVDLVSVVDKESWQAVLAPLTKPQQDELLNHMAAHDTCCLLP